MAGEGGKLREVALNSDSIPMGPQSILVDIWVYLSKFGYLVISLDIVTCSSHWSQLQFLVSCCSFGRCIWPNLNKLATGGFDQTMSQKLQFLSSVPFLKG